MPWLVGWGTKAPLFPQPCVRQIERCPAAQPCHPPSPNPLGMPQAQRVLKPGGTLVFVQRLRSGGGGALQALLGGGGGAAGECSSGSGRQPQLLNA